MRRRTAGPVHASVCADARIESAGCDGICCEEFAERSLTGMPLRPGFSQVEGARAPGSELARAASGPLGRRGVNRHGGRERRHFPFNRPVKISAASFRRRTFSVRVTETKRNSGLGGGGGTPRPPLEQSGSRPDGGGGRHRPAASTHIQARPVPIDASSESDALCAAFAVAQFISEMYVSFLKRLIAVKRLGVSCVSGVRSPQRRL